MRALDYIARMKNYSRHLLSFLKFTIVSLMVLGALFFFIDPRDLQSVKSITLFDTARIFLAAQIVYTISGIELAIIVFFNSRVRLWISDVLFLPITMNLWSFLIPFQGSLVYSSLILKYKYKTSLSNAVSTSVFSYLLSIILTGFFGTIFCILSGDVFSIFMAISLGFLFFPALLLIAEYLISAFKIDRFHSLKTAVSFLTSIITQLRALFVNHRLLLLIIITNIFHIIFSFLMNYYSALALGYNIPFSSMIVFTLLIRLSVILKLTPGNLGIQEILSGGIFSVMALDPAQGILITLVTRLVTIIQMCTIGVIDTVRNTKYFELSRLFDYQKAA